MKLIVKDRYSVSVDDFRRKTIVSSNINFTQPLASSYPSANTPLSDDDKFIVRQGSEYKEVEKSDVKEIVNRVGLNGTELDWKKPVEYVKTLTQNETFTDTNLPTGTKTGFLILHLTGDFAITFPSYWQHKGGSYDGSKWNMIVADCLNGNSGDEKINYTILTDE